MPRTSGLGPFPSRQERLRSLLDSRRLPLVLVTKPASVFYLTGFRGSVGVAVLGLQQGLLWVDPRYNLQAREQARGVEVVEERGALLGAAGLWLKSSGVRRMGYEDLHLTCASFREVERLLPRTVRLAPVGSLVDDMRYVKDPEEVECIRDAGRITAAVFEDVIHQIRPGIREADLAAEVDYRMKRRGAEGIAFETIVASGERSAWPHARASSNLLRKSELVILDLGAILGGYAADMTRTLYLGEPPRRIRGLYNAVCAAQRRVIDHLRPGVRAGDADAAARRLLARRGLESYFTHSAGHGVGLEVHEKPRLSRGEKTRLRTGCVVTAEPGVYLEGLGGIRIEDTVLVGPHGPEILTPAPKDSWFVA